MTEEELIARAEREVEQREDGTYAIYSVDKLSGEEFAELIMAEVRELQKSRKQ